MKKPTSRILSGGRHTRNSVRVRLLLVNKDSNLLAAGAVDDRGLAIGRPTTQHAAQILQGRAFRDRMVLFSVLLCLIPVDICRNLLEFDVEALAVGGAPSQPEAPTASAGQRQGGYRTAGLLAAAEALS